MRQAVSRGGAKLSKRRVGWEGAPGHTDSDVKALFAKLRSVGNWYPVYPGGHNWGWLRCPGPNGDGEDVDRRAAEDGEAKPATGTFADGVGDADCQCSHKVGKTPKNKRKSHQATKLGRKIRKCPHGFGADGN